jgi:hypothetical protein
MPIDCGAHGEGAHSAKAFWPNQSPRLLIRLTHARNKNRLNKADEATEDVEEIELTDQMKNSFFHLFKQPEEGSEEVSLMDRLNPMNAFQGPTKCPHCGESLIPKVTHPSNSSWSRFPSFLLTSSFFFDLFINRLFFPFLPTAQPRGS